VVVAEDQQSVRNLLRDLLDLEEGLEVVGTAADGAEAMRCADELHPDAIVLDLSMPVMDGETALPELAESCPTRRSSCCPRT
jgi:DNA-binding NarL/FixJ family response regulator